MKKIIIFVSCLLASFSVVADCINRNVDMLETKPNNIYVDHGDGTVTDKETGLMWQKCTLGLSGNDCLTGSVGVFTWQAALATTNENSDSAYTDWRLPNVKEILSLVEVACFTPVVNSALFPNSSSPNNIYWTSSPNINFGSTDNAFIVNFSDGFISTPLKNVDHNVRLVRNIK
ncbi:MAG: DUF1566 domain-containing protein [Woeseiaceae bacterium]